MPYKDPEKQRAHRQAWQKANLEKGRANATAWREANPEKNRAIKNAWRKANLEKVRATEAKWRKANPEKCRDYRRKRKTGWPLGRFEVVREMQGNACAICNKPLGSRACADHDHKTMQPRGALCMRCNTALGIVEATLEALEPEILAVVMKSQSPWIVYLATDWAAIHANLDKPRDEATIPE